MRTSQFGLGNGLLKEFQYMRYWECFVHAEGQA